MSLSVVLRRISSALDEFGIEYMLTGSLVSSGYGRPRSTNDIDIVIEANPEQLHSFIQQLEKNDYYADLDTALQAQRHESLFNVIDRKTSWKIDLIFRKSRPYSNEAFRRRRLLELEGVKVYVASVEDIIIAKMEWAKQAQSQRQIEDVVSILKLRGQDLDELYLQNWIQQLGLNSEWEAVRRDSGFPEKS